MLPHFVRFRDLKERNIVQSWPALNDLIENEGFPRGRKLSPQIRVWTVAEVNEWLETRPFEPAEPRGIARAKAEQAANQLLNAEADGAVEVSRGPPSSG